MYIRTLRHPSHALMMAIVRAEEGSVCPKVKCTRKKRKKEGRHRDASTATSSASKAHYVTKKYVKGLHCISRVRRTIGHQR